MMRQQVRGLRMIGSAAIQAVHVGCGRSSCFVEAGPHPWDVCAAAIIVTEAGGVLADMNGGEFSLSR